MNFVQTGRGFAVGLIIFECALTVERCALMLITPFSKIKSVEYGYFGIFGNTPDKKIGH